MRVSSRYASMVAAVAAGLITAAAAAQHHAPTPPSPPPPHNPCCGHPGGPIIHAPSIHIGGPSVHVGGPSIHVGGVHVNSNVNVNVVAQASASATAIANASGGAAAGAGSTIIYAGGGYVAGGSTPAPTALTGLRIAGLEEYELIEEERTRWVEEWRLIRAVCIDDHGAPHPASRVDPDERVHPDFDGEIYRCMAGTYLHATFGWREDGHDRFDGESIQCEKGEALRHAPGGRLHCATQEPRRNCNERSLLRLHGPGVKWVYYRYEETYMETVERRMERSESYSMTLMLNGGVGGYR